MVFVPWVKVSLLKISLYRLGLTSDHTDSLLPSWGDFWVKIVPMVRKTMNHATSRENKHVSEMPCTLHSCGTRQLFNEIVTRPLGFYYGKEEICQRSLSWRGKSRWSEVAWAVDVLKRGPLSYCWVPSFCAGQCFLTAKQRQSMNKEEHFVLVHESGCFGPRSIGEPGVSVGLE